MTEPVCSLLSSPSWVGYEKEGFRGHQYLLEEGEYADWSHWGGYDEALTSLRVIRTVGKGNWASGLSHTPPVQSVEGRICAPPPCSPEHLKVFPEAWPLFLPLFPRPHRSPHPKVPRWAASLGPGQSRGFPSVGGRDLTILGAQDFADPAVVLFEAMDFEGHCVEVSEPLPDVELARHGPHTQAIHVLSGV